MRLLDDAPAITRNLDWICLEVHVIECLPHLFAILILAFALLVPGQAPASREPFGGFGDPVLDGSGERARRANIPALYSRGAVADVKEVRKLARLAESAGELRAIAAALNAPVTSIRLGAAATEKGSELDDGLLTAGEISQLKLDADWVILSACNTAAPDGTPGAEALRRSMLALMARTDKPYFAHPAFWAPFVLVGEGSSIRR